MKIILSLLVFFLLTACVTIEAPEVATPSPVATTTQTPTFTPTVDWFPATATATLRPTKVLSPTPDQRPRLGENLLSDDFSDPDIWALARTAEGSIALGKNELTIAIAGEKSYLYSVRREPLLGNFYAEITASPTLCRGQDEFGFLLRVSENNDYYRFALSCDGQAKVSRVVNRETTTPQPWMPSGAIPPGAPSTSRLAVWLQGSEMRFFANDEYLFTVRDPLITSGNIGVFARSTGDLPVTVNFSDLVVKKINP
jgi:hypothetical protein